MGVVSTFVFCVSLTSWIATGDEQLTDENSNKWMKGLTPYNSLSWLKTFSDDLDDSWKSSYQDDAIKSRLAVSQFAGVWEELSSISSPTELHGVLQSNVTWSDMLRFIEAGKPDNILRLLDRRKPSQEMSIALDDCFLDISCSHFEVSTSVRFTTNESRESSAKLGVPRWYKSEETGKHQVLTNLVLLSGVHALVQSTLNPQNGQRHEHTRIVLSSPNQSSPPYMIYRWYVSRKDGSRDAMVKIYRKSPATSRENHPTNHKFSSNMVQLSNAALRVSRASVENNVLADLPTAVSTSTTSSTTEPSTTSAMIANRTDDSFDMDLTTDDPKTAMRPLNTLVPAPDFLAQDFSVVGGSNSHSRRTHKKHTESQMHDKKNKNKKGFKKRHSHEENTHRRAD
eukprot:GHVH01014904.1.p1 GENE.GHVH01014904.1~~GHVH01014904.1.p1  ORF type:complete len:397 (+),score=41.81 GHVH01014904.1:275-1465(+)